MKGAERPKCVSIVAAWALAFGCAIGWDAFVLPWTTFLPQGGWAGSIIGIVLSGLVMSVVAWNYHYMSNLSPGPGGVYAYASRAFGCDHGFLCSWFLCLSYAAIVWADASALGMLAHYLLGNVMHSPFHYTVAGQEVCLSSIAMPILAITVTAVICCRRRLTMRVQTLLASGLALGIIVCLAIVLVRYFQGEVKPGPAFAASPANPIAQIFGILLLTPWLFVGFEMISNISYEFRFPVRKSFGVMAVVIGTSVLAYALLTLTLAFCPARGSTGLDNVVIDPSFYVHQAIGSLCAVLGPAGSVVFGVTIFCALFTNLIGCSVAVATLVSAMSADGALPAWLGRRSMAEAPRNAIIALSVALVFVVPLGQSVIDIFVDIALVGMSIAYAYTSAAAFKLAKAERNRVTMAFGAAGCVISTLIGSGFIVSAFMTEIDLVSTESYLIMVVWCLAGLLMFLYVFRHDRLLRFGRSQVVWISMLTMILLLAVSWIYQATYKMTDKAYAGVMGIYADVSTPGGAEEVMVARDNRFSELFAAERTRLTNEIMVNNIVLTALVGFAVFLMVALYNILRKRERELEREKAKAKSYFFSTVSHDIRTPLNAIIGFTEMLKMGMKSEEERSQALDAIAVSGKTLLGLVNDILDLSKLEAGKMTISPEPTDCVALFRGIMDSFRISAAKPDLEFQCKMKAMPLLLLDPLRIRQIVFNLVGNATKFTLKGHVTLRASYERLPGAEDGVFRFHVEDTGCGISEEDLRRIGGAYVQVGAKHARNGGTGLGLAICRHLTQAMGGRITVQSKLGKGSTFAIEIPRVKAVQNAERETAMTFDDLGNKKSHKVRRILIVDDQKMNRMVLMALLRTAGDFEVVTANDGREALEILQAPDAAPLDLVMTDLWMPNLDGEGLVKAIRADKRLSGLRVIAVTADVEFNEKAAGAGFDGVLYKPVTAAKLVRAIHGEV